MHFHKVYVPFAGQHEGTLHMQFPALSEAVANLQGSIKQIE